MASIDDMKAEDRALAYDLLAAVLGSAPTAESVSALSYVARAFGIYCPDDLALREVQREFMDLLIVPNPRYAAPYESAYRDGRLAGANGIGPRSAGLLMGDSTLAVRQAFVDAGVLPVQDLPDHIANELRLVSHLWHVEACGDSEQAAEAARQREVFVAEHVTRWIGELAGRIAQNSATGFYRAAIETVRALLDGECARDDLERAAAVSGQKDLRYN